MIRRRFRACPGIIPISALAKRILATALADDDRRAAEREARRWQAAARENSSFEVQRRYDREQVRGAKLVDANTLTRSVNGVTINIGAEPAPLRFVVRSDRFGINASKYLQFQDAKTS